MLKPDRRHRHVAAAVSFASALLLMQGAAGAQTVQVFEYTPPLEQLRNILVPESAGGASRKIVLPRRDQLDAGRPVQQASATRLEPVPSAPAAEPQSTVTPAAVTAPASPEPQLTPAVATAPAPQLAKAVPRQPEGDAAGVVGFRINFALDSAVVPDSADPFLDRLAELLKQEPQLALRIEGHTDAYGSDEYNLRLSERRATAVGLALVRRGIPAGRLAVAGKGKTEPLVADPYDPHNRRVQFARIDGAAR